MVSNTESINSNQFSMTASNSSSGAGAIGRLSSNLRQTLQQAHDTVSTRLQQNRTGAPQQPSDLVDIPNENIPNVNVSTPVEEKENQEAA